MTSARANGSCSAPSGRAAVRANNNRNNASHPRAGD